MEWQGMTNSTAEGRELLNDFLSRRGETVNKMRSELRDMLTQGHGNDLLLYATELQNQYGLILQFVTSRPAIILGDDDEKKKMQ
jgi:hypothetical protein